MKCSAEENKRFAPLPPELITSPAWRDLERRFRDVYQRHADRRRGFKNRRLHDLSANEQSEAIASIGAEEREKSALRMQALELMKPFGYPRQLPLSSAGRMANELAAQCHIAELVAMIDGDDAGTLARDILRKYEVDAGSILGSINALPNTGDPVRDLKRLILVLETTNAPTLTKCEAEIIEALRSSRSWMTGARLFRAASGGKVQKALLSSMVKRGLLTNRASGSNRGYGLPEWDARGV